MNTTMTVPVPTDTLLIPCMARKNVIIKRRIPRVARLTSHYGPPVKETPNEQSA